VNTGYAGQSRASYMLAFQMIWTSYSTTKFISADMKFRGAEAKKEKKEKAKDAAGPAPAGPAPAGPTTDPSTPAPSDGSSTDGGSAAAPVVPATPAPEETDHAVLEVVDRNNGKLVLKDGTVKTIKDGKIISVNGKPVDRPRDATKSEKDSLEKEEKERNKFVVEDVACTGWYCL